jgi:hypothetical protein
MRQGPHHVAEKSTMIYKRKKAEVVREAGPVRVEARSLVRSFARLRTAFPGFELI